MKVTATDGSSASVSDIFDIVVGNTNDAPVLNAGATPVLAAENEDAGAPVGAVGTLVSSLVNLTPPVGVSTTSPTQTAGHSPALR